MKHIKDLESILELLNMPGKRGNKVESWVNVKIDKDLHLRISRFTSAIDEFADAKMTNLEGKLDILSNPSVNKYGVQCKLSIVMLLQYLKEIKSNFDASSSGHLFEDYIAGLLHGKKKGGYGPVDFVDKNKLTYQIKFYDYKTSQLKVNPTLCDYYILGLKTKEKAQIWIIDYNQIGSDGENYIYLDEKGLTKVNISLLKKDIKPHTLDLSNLDSRIDLISESLRKFIEDLYEEISQLHYNIETILTGVDEDNRVIEDVTDINDYYDGARINIKNIDNHLKNVKAEIRDRIRRYKNR